MTLQPRSFRFAFLGAVFAATAVAAGAFGAHALKTILDPPCSPYMKPRHGTKCTMRSGSLS